MDPTWKKGVNPFVPLSEHEKKLHRIDRFEKSGELNVDEDASIDVDRLREIIEWFRFGNVSDNSEERVYFTILALSILTPQYIDLILFDKFRLFVRR